MKNNEADLLTGVKVESPCETIHCSRLCTDDDMCYLSDSKESLLVHDLGRVDREACSSNNELENRTQLRDIDSEFDSLTACLTHGSDVNASTLVTDIKQDELRMSVTSDVGYTEDKLKMPDSGTRDESVLQPDIENAWLTDITADIMEYNEAKRGKTLWHC